MRWKSEMRLKVERSDVDSKLGPGELNVNNPRPGRNADPESQRQSLIWL